MPWMTTELAMAWVGMENIGGMDSETESSCGEMGCRVSTGHHKGPGG